MQWLSTMPTPAPHAVRPIAEQIRVPSPSAVFVVPS
jgi:hypothetical protein